MGLAREEEIVADGRAPEDQGQPGNGLYVTCGIGFGLVPLRINAPPEVTFFGLVPPAEPRHKMGLPPVTAIRAPET